MVLLTMVGLLSFTACGDGDSGASDAGDDGAGGDGSSGSSSGGTSGTGGTPRGGSGGSGPGDCGSGLILGSCMLDDASCVQYYDPEGTGPDVEEQCTSDMMGAFSEDACPDDGLYGWCATALEPFTPVSFATFFYEENPDAQTACEESEGSTWCAP